MATLACSVTKVKRAQLGYVTRNGAKFGRNRSPLSTRYAAPRQADTFTDDKGDLNTRQSKKNHIFDGKLQRLKCNGYLVNTER